MLAAVSPRTDRSSHNHGTRGKPGPAAPPAPLARMGGWPPGTLRNGHATRMSPDRGHCRGSGLNDVHRGVGGTVVTVSSPYAKFMTHNASLSIPGRLGCAGGPFCPCGRQIKTDSIRGKQRRLTHKSREKTDAQSHAFARDRGAVRVIGGLDGRRANLARGRQDCCGCAEFYADRTGDLPGMGTLLPSRIYQGLRSVSVLVSAVLAAC